LSTDWIPELLGRLESETKDKEHKDKDGTAAATTAAAAAAVAKDEAAAGAAAMRKAKRERSKTSQGPTPEQLLQLQALFAAGDSGQLRNISKAEAHLGSFNRHFPTARMSSKTQDVLQVRVWQLGTAGTDPPESQADLTVTCQ
jgi:hypothetical protein